MTEYGPQFWDEHAASFDEEADHGLRDPAVRQAWQQLLLPLLPTAPATAIDIGCGTGSLSVLLAQAGHHVHAVDSAPQMLDLARRKAADTGVAVAFMQADAAHPPFAPSSFDVVLARHVLWALPEPDAVLTRWISLLRPHGQLILIEGRWSTGAGLPAKHCRSLVLRHRRRVDVRMLNDPALWGTKITDERYLLLSHH
ncbi:class I SAM-dependent methyltransferase [Plantactinospora sp. CA-294935]|uniref:class I SAM-dependent methyltransferase n=1 Tax=Plantactinospora sp. CA-294935 TaxID=3240012 RepID=UPI003D8F40BF